MEFLIGDILLPFVIGYGLGRFVLGPLLFGE